MADRMGDLAAQDANWWLPGTSEDDPTLVGWTPRLPGTRIGRPAPEGYRAANESIGPAGPTAIDAARRQGYGSGWEGSYAGGGERAVQNLIADVGEAKGIPRIRAVDPDLKKLGVAGTATTMGALAAMSPDQAEAAPTPQGYTHPPLDPRAERLGAKVRALGDFAAEKAAGFVDYLKTPGDILAGKYTPQPVDPRVWSEYDQEARNQGAKQLEDRARLMALETMWAASPFAQTNAVGMAGGRLPTPQYRGEPMGSIAEQKIYKGYPAETADVSKLQPRNITKYVDEPQRVAFPGVYKNPRVIAEEAAANVAPEHPALKQLFGVTRDDLYGISQGGTRAGNMEPRIWYPEQSRGSYAADAIMNKRNAQRMIDALSEAERYPQLTRGMDAWYVMDPAFARMEQLVGREQAIKDYQRFNMTVPPFSAGSDVLTEINRGTAANMMATRGEYPTFVRYGGVKETARGTDFPPELRDVRGHAYHGIQADPVTRYLATGEHGYHPDTVKIPLYSQASGVPETGFQTRLPVPDAHFARASGMADVRKNKSFADYMSGSEYRPYGPWYRENVAKPLGIEAVPAQGRMWGVYAPQTGVETAVGAPKLELLAQAIWERAQRLGIDPRTLRDQVLSGKGHATWLLPGVTAPYVLGGIADQTEYRQ